MNMDKLYKINKIEKQILELEEEKQSVLNIFEVENIEDKSSSTYKIMKKIRDKKFIELDAQIDELMIEHKKLLQ